MRRRLAIAASALLLAACPASRERAQLENELASLRSQRDKLARIAEHLDEFRDATKKAEDELRAQKSLGIDLDHEARVAKAATIAGVTSKRQFPMNPSNRYSPVDLSGLGAESFERLRSELGAIAVEKIVFTPGPAWVVTIPAWDNTTPFTYDPNPTATQTPSLRSRPPRGRFTSKRTLRLHEEIDAVEKEIAELDRLVQGVTELEAMKTEIERYRNVLDTPSRLTKLATLARPLFLEPSSRCTSGSLSVFQQSVRFFCAPRGGKPEEAADAIRTAFASDLGWKLGTVSIDDSAAESVQATLTPVAPNLSPSP